MAKTSPAQQRAAIALLLSMVLLGVFPLDVVLPSFPALAEHFDRAPSDIAFSISLFAMGISLSQLVIGPLSDTLGRKSLLLAGMAVAVLGAAGCVFTTDYPWFLFFRCVQALGCGCFVLSQALVQDLFVGEERNRLRIMMVTASGIFISVSPLAGSVLQQFFDWPGSFWGFIALAAIVFLKALHTLQDPPQATQAPLSIAQSYLKVCRDSAFVGYWLIAAITFTCHFSFIVVSPLLFMEQLQFSAYAFSLMLLVYGAAYLSGGVVARVLSTRVRASTQIILGLALICCAGVMMLAFRYWVGLTPASILLPMIVCTAGTTITRPIATSKAMDVFPELAGTAASVGNTLVFICGGLISALINLSANNLQTTLALSFIALSALALALNARINLLSHSLQRPAV